METTEINSFALGMQTRSPDFTYSTVRGVITATVTV